MGSPEASWTYVLITPDAVVTESVPWLLDTFRAHGLEPVAGRLITVRSATMLGLYDTPARTRPVSLPPRRAFDLWYAQGPGCVVSLRHEGAGACAAMLELKGATDPAAARPGSIRHVGENGLTNLVHCPDGEAEAAHELGRLVGDRCATFLRELASAPDGRVRALTVDAMPDGLPAYSGVAALSPPLIINRIRLRLVQHLAVGGMAGDAALTTLLDLRATLSAERAAVAAEVTSSGRAGVARAYHARLHDGLTEAARQCGAPETIGILDGLAAFLTDAPHDWPATLAALRDVDIYVSGTEESALELHTYL